MSVNIIPFDQADFDLKKAAHDFCKRELTLPEGETEWNLHAFAKAWIAVEENVVVGVTAFLYRVDIAVFRSTSNKATTRLNQRLHSYFADQGLLGQDIFIHLSEKTDPAQMCANWEEEINKAGVKPAERYLVRVKPL